MRTVVGRNSLIKFTLCLSSLRNNSLILFPFRNSFKLVFNQLLSYCGSFVVLYYILLGNILIRFKEGHFSISSPLRFIEESSHWGISQIKRVSEVSYSLIVLNMDHNVPNSGHRCPAHRNYRSCEVIIIFF